ncbi:hypothetical protein [Vreelandella populi]|uniref:hypothetical protein n=1 Tax=Vreelandella populi TaxID=2498858 RepID=UPI000F8C5A94|nr:hypothetical protein [Halomonas populi]RUR38520.1 hypothetical protein ELY25_09150 [Halomonas populi]
MKPIEPGCLCLVVGGDPSAVGETCTAIAWVSDGESFKTSNGWYDNTSGLSGWAVEFSDGCGVYLPAKLRRIDDYDASADATEQDREVEHG